MVQGGVCAWWDSVVTPESGSPLSSGAGGLWLIKMQGTGWQAAAAATGRTRQKKAEGMAGAAEEKPTKGAAPPPAPTSLALEF